MKICDLCRSEKAVQNLQVRTDGEIKLFFINLDLCESCQGSFLDRLRSSIGQIASELTYTIEEEDPDKRRMDHLEKELQREGQEPVSNGSLFRRNNVITRKDVDEAILARGEKL